MAQILYTVENKSDQEKTVRSRLLMDTMLGEQDYALYEAGNNILGDGFQDFIIRFGCRFVTATGEGESKNGDSHHRQQC